MRVGTPAIIADAISTLYSLTLVLDKTMLFKATWIGAALPKEKVAPNKKSFHICVNCQITVTVMIGNEIGSSILKNILKDFHLHIHEFFLTNLH